MRSLYDAAMKRLLFHPLALPLLLLFGGVGPLGFALFSQYVLGLHPCHYCILQRYPYMLPIFAGLLALCPLFRPHRGKLVLLAVLGWLATAAIAVRHVAIEQGFVVEAGGCSAGALSGSAADIKAQIMGAPLVACNQVSAEFLGISMAAWNALCALFFCAAVAYIWRNQTRNIA